MAHFKDSKRTISKERQEFPIRVLHAYPRAYVGWGAHTMLGIEAKKLGMKHAMIVTTGLRGTGIIDEIRGILQYAGVTSDVYTNVTGNPKDHEVMEGYKSVMKSKSDGLISIGGGSTIDCCKGIRLVHSHEGKHIREFEGAFKAIMPNKIPHLSVNTTSGTGSEVSCFCIINHTDEKYKMAIFDPTCTPSMAVDDPLLHQTMPADLTAYTGMDALTHAVEAIASRLQVQAAYGPGLWAIGQIFQNLREASANRNNDRAMEQMVWAELAAGVSFNSAGLGIVHSMAHVLGGLYDSPHGLCNAIGLVDSCRHNLPGCPGRFKIMAEAAGLDVRGLSDYKAGEKFIDAVEELRNELGIYKNFKDLGMRREDLDLCARKALKDICTEGNPIDMGFEDMRRVFATCMEGHAPNNNRK
ncbi:MAG: iron-containing alcohol dehydrogenase [Oligoflexia bacterium]|nr:iron-containing alcohol dehydrogenase [Oligoflexia bacterium]